MKIHSQIKDYRVEFVDDVLSQRVRIFSGLKFNRAVYFVDRSFYRHYEAALKRFIGNDLYLLIDATEKNKSYGNLADYYRFLIEERFTRQDLLVTFGGGILQDVSGFIASTLYRGIPWAFFPTTLLSQADSCIGSKTSVNFEDSKNLIGTFYPPDFIAIDVGFCQTLTPEYFNSGLGEIIKFHLLSDRSRMETLTRFLRDGGLGDSRRLKEIVLSTLEIKKSYFEGDEFDAGRRNLLNYGHCYGHALESASNFAISHGEAVIVGMGLANLVSLERGILSRERYDEFEGILSRFYPKFDLGRIPVEDLIAFLKKDKKRTGKDLTMILARDVGDHIKATDIREEEVRAAHERFCKLLGASIR